MVTIDLYADIACPWCRLGLHRFRQAVRVAGCAGEVRTQHLPYQLDSTEPDTPVPLPEMMTRKYGQQAVRAMFAEMRALGEKEGMVFDLENGQAVNTFTAHRLLWLAGRSGDGQAQGELASLLYDAYFQHGLNVADRDVLAGLAGKAGLDPAAARSFLDSGEGAEEVRELAAAARTLGVVSVPTFVFPDGTRASGAGDVGSFARALRHHLGHAEAPAPSAASDTCAI